jgi:hypothetical protein
MAPLLLTRSLGPKKGEKMTPIIISICITTGVCGFLFLVLPAMDAAAEKKSNK